MLDLSPDVLFNESDMTSLDLNKCRHVSTYSRHITTQMSVNPDVLSLTKWRHHEKCENLAHLTDDQSYQDVDTLGTLFVKLRTLGEGCSCQEYTVTE
jgi:hypothetical protein